MEAERPFDTVLRRTGAIFALGILAYSFPPVRQRIEKVRALADTQTTYALRWMRNQTLMPWEKELIGETEELRRIVLPQPKPGWYGKDTNTAQ